jgi:protein O-GlcNAc transferase
MVWLLTESLMCLVAARLAIALLPMRWLLSRVGTPHQESGPGETGWTACRARGPAIGRCRSDRRRSSGRVHARRRLRVEAVSVASTPKDVTERHEVEALTELGARLCQARRIGEAESALLDAHRRTPQPSARLCAKLAIVRLVQGRPDESLRLMRMATAADPGNAALHSKLIGILAYHPGFDTSAIKAEQHAWDRQHGRVPFQPAKVVRPPHPKLRIGYVARDFGRGSVVRVCRSVIAQADRDRFAIYCYSGAASWDQSSLDLCFRVDAWRTTGRLDDDALATRIRQDEIDVLVDLDGHTDGNRLPVFCRRPAPVQLSGWGYLPGPGISAISGLMTDPIVMPAAERGRIPEACLDLPCAHEYQPPYPPLDPSPPPSRARGYLTLACFNRLEKISPEVWDVWSAILNAVAGSRLVLMDAAFGDAHMQANVVERFARRGIDADRIDLGTRRSFADYLAAYRDIDIALDPWPHSGGLTTLDALWMGVPVVTRAGNHALGRTSASVLTCLHLGQLIAADSHAYVETVMALARMPEQLAEWRLGLRHRIEQSVIGDAPGYARAVEAAYRQAWECRDE